MVENAERKSKFWFLEMDMEKYCLEDLCSLITDGTHQTPEYSEYGYIFLSSKDVTTRKIDWDNTKRIPENLHEKLSLRLKPQMNDVLLAKNGTTGVAAIVDREEEFDIYVSLALLRPKDVVYPRYLWYAVNSPYAKKQFNRGLKGIGVPNLHLSVIKKTQIPLPDYDNQQRIVNILENVDSLIEMEKKQIEIYETLIKSRFVEMFGDPVSDSMHWGQKPLKEMLESIRYGASTPPEFSDVGYAFIRATNIKCGRIVKNEMKYIPQSEADKLEKCKLSGGEVLIVRSGVNAGDICVVTDEYIGQYAGYDMILVLKSDLHPVFFNALVNTTYMEKVIKPLTRRAAQPHLNSEQTQSFPIIQVPYDLQKQFALFVQQVDKLKATIQQSIDELQLLFESLMQKYFS